MEKIKRKKLSSKKKKFFIWASCYFAVFLITAILTMSTLSWFSGSTWSDGEMYMGGPVYIDFTDNNGIKTSGKEQLTTETPPGWSKLYPGMNIHFEASVTLENHTKPNNQPVTAVSSAVMRAKILLEIIDKEGFSTNDIDQSTNPDAYNKINLIYNSIWSQLKYKAQLKSEDNVGYWIFNKIESKEQDNYFYYINEETYNTIKSNNGFDINNCILEEVGKTEINESVSFLNNVVVTIPGLTITNDQAECKIKFTIVFQALQAFFGHNEDNTQVPLTIGNSIPIYAEALDY